MSNEILQLGKVLWKYHNHVVPTEKADVIIGLGSYDTKTAVHCAKLYTNGVAPLVVFTGKDGNWTRGKWEKTEAEMFGDVALELGVKAKGLLLEKEATNIGENLSFTKELLKDQSIKSVMIVTKPNTLRRAKATADVQLKNWDVYTACVDCELEDQISSEHSLEDLINEMTGDLQRIIDYPAKGFQSKQGIPDDVLKAFQQLKSLGFNQH